MLSVAGNEEKKIRDGKMSFINNEIRKKTILDHGFLIVAWGPSRDESNKAT